MYMIKSMKICYDGVSVYLLAKQDSFCLKTTVLSRFLNRFKKLKA